MILINRPPPPAYAAACDPYAYAACHAQKKKRGIDVLLGNAGIAEALHGMHRHWRFLRAVASTYHGHTIYRGDEELRDAQYSRKSQEQATVLLSKQQTHCTVCSFKAGQPTYLVGTVVRIP